MKTTERLNQPKRDRSRLTHEVTGAMRVALRCLVKSERRSDSSAALARTSNAEYSKDK